MKRKASQQKRRKKVTAKRRQPNYANMHRAVAASALGDELKVFTVTTNATAGVGAASQIIALSNVGIGTAYNQRLGNKISLHKIHLKMTVTVADSSNVIHYRLIQWNATGTPVLADIVDDTTYTYLSYVNYNNLDKIQTLSTGTFTLTQGNNDVEFVEQHKFLNDAQCRWLAASTTKDSGQLYLLLTSDSAAVSHPSYYLKCRLRFRG